MNLLIVDDEYYSVENLRKMKLWQELDFDCVFCAYSMEQAKAVFSEHIVDVLLCDIEMPQGSGLDLLEWVRAQECPAICIFLTCFARFDYASRAIKLESSDYLVKPVEEADLRAAVTKAIEKRRRAEAEHLNELHAEYWNDSGVQRTEQFWVQVCDGSISSGEAALSHELAVRHLPESLLTESYFPALLDCRPDKATLLWEPSVYAYALKNILNETLSTPQGQPCIAQLSSRQGLLLIRCPAAEKAAALESCRNALQACQATLPGIFHLYFSPACTISQVSDTCRQMQQAAYNDISDHSIFCDLTEAAPEPEEETPHIPAEHWNDLLLSRKNEEIQRESLQYLQELERTHRLNRASLTALFHDFSQILYAQLEKYGTAAHDLLSAVNPEVSEYACDSIDAMEQWITCVLTAYAEELARTEDSGTVLESIRRYVRAHLAEDINRNSLAQAVYLSPDYLSHLFREKAGISLTAFITNERIRRAKELLNQNQLSIRDIALASGFQNISYFSKQFKKTTGMTPQEFRKGKG